MLNWDYESELHKVEGDAKASVSSIYAELLARSGVASVTIDEHTHYQGVFSYDAVKQATEDTETFSSVMPLRGARILPLQADPPEHGVVRRLLNGNFRPGQIRTKEPIVRKMAAEMIEAAIEAGTFDMGEGFAYPLPTRTLCNYIGIPDEDWLLHHRYIMDLEKRTKHGLNSPDESVIPPSEGLVQYLLELIAERREEPGDDPISAILQAELNGEPISDFDAMQLCIAMLMAGHITTSSATGSLVLRLATDLDLQVFLRKNPERIPDAVEESLRLDSPQQAMQRRCRRDTVLAGQSIKAGDAVLINFGSANVDPEHFENPATFDIDRKDKRHVAFGSGIHMCVGAPLARMELRIVAEELLARTSRFELDGPVRRLAWPRLAVENLPIRFVAAGK